MDWGKQLFLESIELDITLRCNLRCMNCDRAIRHAPSNEDMSLEQIKKFMQETQDTGWKWKRLKLIGGEPTLHPKFREIIQLMQGFHEHNPQCQIELWTNGYDPQMLKKLESLPSWIRVMNSDKKGIRNAFVAFNMAPRDDKRYEKMEAIGCPLLKHCGIGLNKYGYYPCAAGSTCDRVFGLDIGIKSLQEFLDGKWQDQLNKLCQYCGHYKHQFRKKWVRKEKISQSWRQAFANFKKNKPKLTEY